MSPLSRPRWLLCGALCVSSLIPLVASAYSMRTWDLRADRIGWMAEQFIAQEWQPEGLYLRTGSQDGILYREVVFDDAYEAVSIRLAARQTMTVSLLWHMRGTPQNEIREMPFEVVGSEQIQDSGVALNYYSEAWDAKQTDFIGFRFPANVELILQSVSMEEWAWWENALELVTGFWTYDEFRPYSINFLWGPLLSYNPLMHETLNETLPPRAHSATQWMYVVLVILLGIVILLRVTHSRHTPLFFGLLAAIFAGFWLLFDLRMGSEQMLYAVRDLKTFVFEPTGSKTLRTHGNIYDVLEQAMPELQQQETYGLLTMDGFFSLIRYMTYPALPLTPEKDTSKVTLWLVAQRGDIRVNAEGMLQDTAGKIYTGSGRIIRQLTSDSFLFSTAR